MKSIKEYLHLYLGCPCKGKDGSMIYTLQSVDLKAHPLLKDAYGNECVIFDFKPILRPLSDMTEKECDDFGIASDGGEYIHDCFEPDAIYGSWSAVIAVSQFSERINEMRKRHIDVDGLIEAGLAIDSTTINQPQSTT
jgi:hypothetical protein